MKFLKGISLGSLSLIFILLLGALLRGVHIEKVPPSPSLDEVSTGYNAFSILKTGKDEYGTSFPILLRAYDDYRPAFYAYLVIPFIHFFGLTVGAVRAPSVIISLLTLLLTYQLLNEVFGRGEFSIRTGRFNFSVALVATFFLSISPWHVYISRLGHEANLGLISIIGAIFLFIYFIKHGNNFCLVLSTCSFALSFYTYQSEKVIAPLLILSLTVIFWRTLVKFKKALAAYAVIGILLCLPAIIVTLSSTGLLRLKGTSAFDFSNTQFVTASQKQIIANSKGDIVGKILYSQKVTSMRIFLGNYLSHFDPRWLFTGSRRENHKIPYSGLLYTWEFPLIIVGLISLWRSSIDRRIKAFLFIWFFSSPLPASITTQAPHAMRSYTFLPLWQSFSALGLITILKMISVSELRVIGVGVFGIIASVNIFYVWKNYFTVFPQEQSDSFQYALGQAIRKELLIESDYSKIIFSNSGSLYQSYMFYLYYSKFNPSTYLNEGGTYSGGFSELHKIGKVEFRPFSLNESQPQGRYLYVGNIHDFPAGAEVIGTYYNLDMTPAIVMVERKI